MAIMKLAAHINQDRKLIIDLPDDVPVGPVDILILPKEAVLPDLTAAYAPEYPDAWMERREQLRKRLIASHVMSKVRYASEGYIPLSDEERMALVKLPPGARQTDELVDEDRGPR